MNSAVPVTGPSPAIFLRNSKDFWKFSAIHYKDFPLLQAEENGQPGVPVFRHQAGAQER